MLTDMRAERLSIAVLRLPVPLLIATGSTSSSGARPTAIEVPDAASAVSTPSETPSADTPIVDEEMRLIVTQADSETVRGAPPRLSMGAFPPGKGNSPWLCS